jgi:hypothetical protein
MDCKRLAKSARTLSVVKNMLKILSGLKSVALKILCSTRFVETPLPNARKVIMNPTMEKCFIESIRERGNLEIKTRYALTLLSSEHLNEELS